MSAEARFVLDASALLVYLQREPGHERVQQALSAGAASSTVNMAEVYAKVIERDLSLEEIAASLMALGLRVMPFTDEDARGSAALYPKTKRLGLSLGDRACLALGAQLKLPVLTADKAWRAVPGLRIELIR